MRTTFNGFAPNINLVAARINYQVKPNISYHPDTEAFAVDAFHLSWSNYKFYAFPPFSIISLVLQKIQKEHSDGIVVVPRWPTQTWWPVATKMLVKTSVALPANERTVLSFSGKTTDYICPVTHLIIPAQSAKRKTPTSPETTPSDVPLIRKQLQNIQRLFFNSYQYHGSMHPSDQVPDSNIKGTLSKWKLYCSEREVNPFSPTIAEGISFLGELYDEGIGQSGLNTARSALAAIITLSNNISFRNHPCVRRFIKGVYELDQACRNTKTFGMFVPSLIFYKR